jgi:CoA:oxalate CoA-transferase
MSAIACALLYRERSGRGQHLDISLLDSYFHYHEAPVQLRSLSGGKIKPKRMGGQALYVVPAGIFKGKGKLLIIFAQLDHLWAKLCNAMKRPELINDARFATNDDRVAHLSEIVELLEGVDQVAAERRGRGGIAQGVPHPACADSDAR